MTGSETGKTLFQVYTTQGTGTHLAMELVEQAGYLVVAKDIVNLLQSLVYFLESPDARCCISGFNGMTASNVLGLVSEKLGIAPLPRDADWNTAAGYLSVVLDKQLPDRAVVINNFMLSHADDHVCVDEPGLGWSVRQRDKAQELLETAARLAGITHYQSGVIRNPVDILLSYRNRFGQEFHSSVTEYFSLISRLRAERNMTVISYEELCSGEIAEKKRLLQSFFPSREDVGHVDLSIIHTGEVAKWKLLSAAEFDAMADRHRDILQEYGYPDRVERGSAFVRLTERVLQSCNKVVSEIRVINAVSSGDFSHDSAFSRHKYSIPGRVWMRLMFLLPPTRKNLLEFYRQKKNIEYRPPTILESLKRLFS